MNIGVSKFTPQLTLTKKGVTSGGSRSFFFFKNSLPIKLTCKHLLLKVPYNAGRNNTGRIVIRTKKSKTHNYTKPKINYTFRSLNLLFIAGFILMPKVNKLVSLTMLASGSITYTPTSTTHELFKLTRFQSILSKQWNFTAAAQMNSELLLFKKAFFILSGLPKNKPVSFIEPLPTSGIIYVRSTGSSASILKMNSLTSTALVKLPSGVKKVFSTYSLGSLGSVHLSENKKCKVNKAGFYKNLGKKSMVRGVAKNPIDHPHGGRNKAIKYQRTPWGKTTKFK